MSTGQHDSVLEIVANHRHETRSKLQKLQCVEIVAKPAPDSLSPSGGQPLRASTRVPRRRRDSTPPLPQPPAKRPAKVAPSQTTLSPTSSPPVKPRRPWELWNSNDVKLFFEALCEHGKDFEAIQNYIAAKSKKKMQTQDIVPKNKDQIRFFYYRTWHKISKHLDLGDDIKKQTQELYGLINYSALRSKIAGRMNEKNGQKLQELINSGTTFVRTKGPKGSKNIRVKTPICPALKKLHNVEEPKEVEPPPKLPPFVILELRPHNNDAFSRVHSLAQNPNVRLSIPANKHLSTIIRLLSRKWRTSLSRMKDKMDLKLEDDQEKILRLKPTKGITICPITVQGSEHNVSADVTLKSFRKKFINGHRETEDCDRVEKDAEAEEMGEKSEDCHGSQSGNSCAEISSDDSRDAHDAHLSSAESAAGGEKAGTNNLVEHNEFGEAESNLPNCKPADISCDVIASTATTLVNGQQNSIEVLNSDTEQVPQSLSDTESVRRTDTAYTEISSDSGQSHIDDRCKPTCDSSVGEKQTGPTPVTVASKKQKLPLSEEDIRKGWTIVRADNITIGEIYLMLGSPGKVKLEYEWISDDTSDAIDKKLVQCLSKLVSLAATEFKANKIKQANMLSSSPCCCRHSGVPSSPPVGKSTVRSPALSRNTCRTQNPVTPKSSRRDLASSRFIASAVAEASEASQLQAVTPTVTTGIGAVNDSQFDGGFRRPTVTAPRPLKPASTPPVQTMPTKSFIAQIGMMSNTRKKQRKPLVVQRALVPKVTTHVMPFSLVPHDVSSVASGLFNSFNSSASGAKITPADTTIIADTTPINIGFLSTPESASALVGLSSALPASSHLSVPGISHLTNTRTVSKEHNVLLPEATVTKVIVSEPTVQTKSTTLVTSTAEEIQTAIRILPESVTKEQKDIETPLCTSSPARSLLSQLIPSSESVSPDVGKLPHAVSEKSYLNSRSMFDISLQSMDGLTSSGLAESAEKLIDYAFGGGPSFSGLLSEAASKVNNTGKINDSDLTLLANLNVKTDANSHNKAGDTTTSLLENVHTPSHQSKEGTGDATAMLLGNLNPQAHFRGDCSSQGAWLNGEDSHSLFSSLLTDDSPLKNNNSHLPVSLISESSRDTLFGKSFDPLAETSLNTALQAIMTENSVEYSAKFADLAAQIAATDHTKKS